MMALDPAIMIVLTTVLAAGGAALVMTVDRRQRLNTRRVAAIVIPGHEMPFDLRQHMAQIVGIGLGAFQQP